VFSNLHLNERWLAMESLLKSLKKHIECSICLDTYNWSPKLYHVFTRFAVSVLRINKEPASPTKQTLKRFALNQLRPSRQEYIFMTFDWLQADSYDVN